MNKINSCTSKDSERKFIGSIGNIEIQSKEEGVRLAKDPATPENVADFICTTLRQEVATSELVEIAKDPITPKNIAIIACLNLTQLFALEGLIELSNAPETPKDIVDYAHRKVEKVANYLSRLKSISDSARKDLETMGFS